ncbi:MAG: MMPL family transporter, partial [Solirubrobacterales bacterium]|nr:MMPL family transporter [Solirubrobacterales bacterium]
MNETLAARAGRWSAKHRKKAVLGWLAFVIVAVVVGGAVGMKKPNDAQEGVGESGRGDQILDAGYPDKAGETVLIQTKNGTVRDADVRAAVADVVSAVKAQPGVQEVESPYAPGNEGQISQNGRSALVQFEIRGDDDLAEERVGPVEDAVRAAAAQHPGVFVGQFGDASANKALSKAFEDDFKKAESLSLPLTLLILFLAFGAILAAGVPLLLGITAVGATIGLLGPISQLVPLDENISSVVLLVGMAVGVDYTLFYLRREREEKARGLSSREAIGVAAATSGRAILVSGMTVLVAMAGMLFAGSRTFSALGIGAMLVVAVAMIGSVTVVPAMLSLLGDKIDARPSRWLLRKVGLGRVEARLPHVLGRGMRDGGQGGRLWSAVLDRVLRRPALSAAAAAGVLVVLAIPAFSMHTANTGVDDLPKGLEVMQVYDKMQAAFPGGQIPATVVVKAEDVTNGRITSAAQRLADGALKTGQFEEPADITVNPDKTVMSISLPIVGDGTDDASTAAVTMLRQDLIPRFERDAGESAYVTGMTAGSKDFNDLMKARAPIVFAFVLSLAFILLLVTFRSIVIPIKAIVMNLLSVGAAYGVLVWVFQYGNLEGLLGFESNGAVTSWLPMFLFVILFGLSMDYHVFILSRVREAFDSGMRTEDAVAHGIRSTAGVVTSAAIVMVAVFGVFATLSALDFKMMGV